MHQARLAKESWFWPLSDIERTKKKTRRRTRRGPEKAQNLGVGLSDHPVDRET